MTAAVFKKIIFKKENAHRLRLGEAGLPKLKFSVIESDCSVAKNGNQGQNSFN